MSQSEPTRYVTHEHIQPIRQKLDEHSALFTGFTGWRGEVDRRVGGLEKSITKICDTLTGTRSEVTTRQDVLSSQQSDLSRKLDLIAGDNGETKVKVESMSRALDKIALDAAEERGRKEEREKSETKSQASFSRKVAIISATLILLQILVIVSNYLKHP